MKLNLHLVSALFNKTFATCALMFLITTPVNAGGVSVQSLGHSSLLIKGGGKSILLNPFRAVGCAQGLSEPKLDVDIILASSELPDEGARTSKGIFFVQPGSYLVDGFKIDGFKSPHDRLGGRRYGFSTLWKWSQGGLKFLHLGGSVSPLSDENKILLGRPDILIIAVGGGDKVYNGQEAASVVKALNPKFVIPVQYVKGAVPTNCNQTGVEPFLEAMNAIEVRKIGGIFKIPMKTPDKMIITLFK
tara:strand:+ start:1785 stop:2522 length:738 start_codon:yes stop_codon:yes gene_type:complete